VLDFGAVDRLPDGLPAIFGRLLWLMHHDGDIETVELELREHGFLRPGVTVDLGELSAFLAPLAEPSRSESFSFSREWMRGEATRVADLRPANVARRLNLPPSYVLIHRVSTAGIGVLCQLECSGPFRAEVLQWIPGYGPAGDTDTETLADNPVSAAADAVSAADALSAADVVSAADALTAADAVFGANTVSGTDLPAVAHMPAGTDIPADADLAADADLPA